MAHRALTRRHCAESRSLPMALALTAGPPPQSQRAAGQPEEPRLADCWPQVYCATETMALAWCLSAAAGAAVCCKPGAVCSVLGLQRQQEASVPPLASPLAEPVAAATRSPFVAAGRWANTLRRALRRSESCWGRWMGRAPRAGCCLSWLRPRATALVPMAHCLCREPSLQHMRHQPTAPAQSHRLWTVFERWIAGCDGSGATLVVCADSARFAETTRSHR